MIFITKTCFFAAFNYTVDIQMDYTTCTSLQQQCATERSTVVGHRKGSGNDDNQSEFVWVLWLVGGVHCGSVWCSVGGVWIWRLFVRWDSMPYNFAPFCCTLLLFKIFEPVLWYYQGWYAEFLLKVSTNFSMIFSNKCNSQTQKCHNKPFAKFNLACNLLS